MGISQDRLDRWNAWEEYGAEEEREHHERGLSADERAEDRRQRRRLLRADLERTFGPGPWTEGEVAAVSAKIKRRGAA